MSEPEKVKEEMEKLHKLILKQLKRNPVLKGFQLKTFSVTNPITAEFGRICYDDNGQPYWYDKPGSCP